MKFITKNSMLTTVTILVAFLWMFVVECREEEKREPTNGPDWTTPSSEESSTAENKIPVFNSPRPNKHRHHNNNSPNVRGHGHHGHGHGQGQIHNSGSNEHSSMLSLSNEESKNSRLLKFLRHFRLDFSKFDSTCLKRGAGRGVPAPPVANAHVLKYTRRRKVIQPRSRYAMALYECDDGYEFPPESADRMFCSRSKWVGPTPVCLAKKQDVGDDAECRKCDQICTVDSDGGENASSTLSSSVESDASVSASVSVPVTETRSRAVCSCYAGYEMDQNGSCVDVDECLTDNGGCHGICFNKPGSFQCSCPTGFQVGPDGKNCIDRNECLLRNGHGPCQDSCVNVAGSYICSCERIPGTRLSSDKHSCEDIDECLDNNFGCSHTCLNTFGNAFCACPKGFILSSTDYKTCLSDQPQEQQQQQQQQEVEPPPSSSSSSSSEESQPPENLVEPTIVPPMVDCPPGSAPDAENLRICVEHEDCSIDNGGCEHICVPSGSFRFCSCRVGFELLNETACVDVNECAVENGGCDHGCVNYVGGHQCKCKDGFQLDDDKKTCKAAFCMEPPALAHSSWDCFEADGSPLTLATSLSPSSNYIYSSSSGEREDEKLYYKAFRNFVSPSASSSSSSSSSSSLSLTVARGTKCKLRCQPGYILKPPHDLGFGRVGRIQCLPDGNWSPPDSFLKSPCIPATCTKLTAPKEGTLFPPESCHSDSIPLNTQCLVLCSPGYYPKNGRIRTCSKGYRWFPEDNPTCIKLPPTPRPYIHCPSDLKVDLKPGQASAYVKIPQPQANFDWWKYVEAEPPWAKNLEWEVPAGQTQVVFTARSPMSNDTATCTFKIHVIDREAPRVKGCPTSFEIRLSPGETSREVWWSEPKFTDNVRVHYVQQSHSPGNLLSKGQHRVSFIAGDAEGNKARCEFDILLTSFSSGVEDYEMSDWINSHQSLNRHMIICPNLKTGRWNVHYAYYLPAGCRYHSQGLFSKLFKQNTYRNLIPRQRRRTLFPPFSTQIQSPSHHHQHHHQQKQQQHRH